MSIFGLFGTMGYKNYMIPYEVGRLAGWLVS